MYNQRRPIMIGDKFTRDEIRHCQEAMELNSMPKAAFLNLLSRDSVKEITQYQEPPPAITKANCRDDLPESLSWLGKGEDHRIVPSKRKPLAAGAAHENLGIFSREFGEVRGMSDHYHIVGATYTEEERRQLLLSGVRKRRHAQLKHARTDTLGLGKPLMHSQYMGGRVPTPRSYKTALPNNWPKTGEDVAGGPASPSDNQQQQQEMSSSLSTLNFKQKRFGSAHNMARKAHDPWQTVRWGGF